MTTIRIYSKPPIAGATKTRLARTLGDTNAAALHGAFLEDLAARLAASGHRTMLDVTERHPSLLAIASRHGLDVVVQCEGDLGTRMSHSIDSGLADDDSVLLVGSDLPTIRLADVELAIGGLAEADVVFAPTPDGGFGLASARSRVAFGHVRWSTRHVLGDSVANLEAAGHRVGFAPPVLDVDDEDDLRTLRAMLALDRSLAPRTAAVLAEIPRSLH